MSLQWSHTIEGIDWEELSELYRAAPLGDKKPADLEVVFTNSRFTCFVFEAGRLVGVGRVLSDGLDCAYLCDVAVLPSHQGRGIGKAILSDLIDRCRGHRKIILYAVPGKEPFYRKFGFQRMKTAMAIFENEARARELGVIDDT